MPKKVLPEYAQKIKSQLETTNNLVDYFLLCGIPPIICRDKFLYDIKSSEYLELLNPKLKPKILSRFPEFDISTDTIDEEIINYVFPNGFGAKFSNIPLEPITYSIILDNNLSSTDNPQKYLTCLLFYESLTKYKKLQLNIENRKANPKDLLDDDNNTTTNKINNNKQSLYNALYNDSNDQNNKKETINQIKLKNFYIPKCICLISIHPYIKLFEKILSNIYLYSKSAENVGQNIPLEKIITNLIIECPVSPRGLYSIQYTLINDMFTFTNFENNRLQLSEINFRKINNRLRLETIIEGLKHILLGSKILLFGSELNLICESILSFLYLLFPFKYPFQVISCLHKENYSILESISPFIIGINEPYKEDFFDSKEISIDCMNIFVIDLDNKISKALLCEDFPNFPKKNVENLDKEIRILEDQTKRAKFQDSGRNTVNNLRRKGLNNIDNTEANKSPIKFYNEQFQYNFFYFFCEILKHYEKYLNMDYFKSNDSDKVTSIDTLFKCKKFIESHNEKDIPFYTKFVEESQLFADFIYKRMIPRNSQEIIDVLLVNETIIDLKNRNKIIGTQKTEFLNSDGYKLLGKYVVPKAREANKEEIEILKKRVNDYKKKGQITMSIKYKATDNTGFGLNNDVIQKNNNINILKTMKTAIDQALKKDSDEIKEVLYFQYFVFPELDFSIYCNDDNISDYYFPPDYSEEIEAVNTQCISKSSLGQNINKNLEMRNYIYLTWLETWAYTFHYSEKIERQYRFNQMLDILDKIIHHEMNILSLIFEVLNEEREQIMIFKLYQKLLQLKINPNTVIYDIISNILDKDQIKELIEVNKSTNNTNSSIPIKFDINSKIKSSFKERTFLSKSDKLLISSKLKFDIVFPCVKCGKKINLFTICQNYENVHNDTEWVPCSDPKCKEYNLPKIKVKFGFELYPSLQEKKSKKNLSTCKTNEIVLHSPYNLKINIFDVANKHYGNKLKLESFKNEFNPLFWNFIWYCNIHNLDYSIILPYLNKIEQLNEIRYTEPNKEILQISFNNNLYKRNENVIYDIRSNNNRTFSDKNAKRVNIIKQFKKLIIKQEISIQFGRLEKNKYKKNICIVVDHLNDTENLRKGSIANIQIKKEIKDMINNKFLVVPTKIKHPNIGSNNKYPEISIQNIKRNNMKDVMPLFKGNNNINISDIMQKRKGLETKNNKK